MGAAGAISWTWDDTAPDNHPLASYGDYYFHISAMSLSIGAQSLTHGLSNPSAALVRNDLSGDHVNVGTDDVGVNLEQIRAFFNDPTETALSSDALPATLDFHDFADSSTRVVWTLDLDNDFSPDAQITLGFVDSPNPTIPLPSAAGLGFAGLAIVGARRRR